MAKRLKLPATSAALFFASLAEFSAFKRFVYSLGNLSSKHKFKEGQDVTKYALKVKDRPTWLSGSRVQWTKNKPKNLKPILVVKGDHVTSPSGQGQEIWCDGFSVCVYDESGREAGCVNVHSCMDCVVIDSVQECYGEISVWY